MSLPRASEAQSSASFANSSARTKFPDVNAASASPSLSIAASSLVSDRDTSFPFSSASDIFSVALSISSWASIIASSASSNSSSASIKSGFCVNKSFRPPDSCDELIISSVLCKFCKSSIMFCS